MHYLSSEKSDLGNTPFRSDPIQKTSCLPPRISVREITQPSLAIDQTGERGIDGTQILDPKAKITLHPGQILRLDRKHAVRID
jgi:hypothetical protein